MDAKVILSKLIAQYGGTHRAFADAIGVSQPTVASWLAKNGIPRGGKMRIVEAFPEVDMAFLDGKSSVIVKAQPAPARYIHPIEEMGAPFYMNLPASAGQTFAGDYDPEAERIVIPGMVVDAYLPVMGMSLHPTLQNGDTVGVMALKSVDRLRPNDIYLVMTTDNERMIKRIREIDRGDMLTLYSDNPDYAPFQVQKDQVCGVWNVVCVIRNL